MMKDKKVTDYLQYVKFVQKGTPKELDTFISKSDNNPFLAADMTNLFRECYENRRQDFADFLPVFVNHGGNINCEFQANHKKTFFMDACAKGELKIVQKMIELGVDCALKESQNRNALFYCIDYGKENTIPMMEAIFSVCPHLVDYEASNRKTLLIYAIEKLNLVVVKYLLSKGANPNLYLGDTMDTPLHIMAKKYKKKAVENNNIIISIIKALIEKGADRSPVNKQGKTPSQLGEDEECKNALKEVIFSDVPKPQPEPKVNVNATNNGRTKNPEENAANFEFKKQQPQNQNNQFSKPQQEPSIKHREMIKNQNSFLKRGMEKQNLAQQTANGSQTNIVKSNNKIVTEPTTVAQNKEVVADQSELKKDYEARFVGEQDKKFWQKVTPCKRSPIYVEVSELEYYLDEEIRIFTEELQRQNNQSKEYFDELIEKISRTLEETLQIQVTIYGSFATRLCLRESDIDVVVKPKNQVNSDPVAVLQKVDRVLSGLKFVNSTKFIKSASIPVIKVQCNSVYHNKRIDITYQDEKHNGLKCVQIIRQYMSNQHPFLIDNYVQLRPLAYVLKTFIYSSGLYDTYQGGLSSYGLILMIVGFLQREYYERYTENSTAKFRVSHLLIKFLLFFGFYFEYVNKSLCVQDPFHFDKEKLYDKNYQFFQWPSPVAVMIQPQHAYFIKQLISQDLTPKLDIRDPLNVLNNVGRSTHQIKHIQMAFCIAFTDLTRHYSCGYPECKYKQAIDKVELPAELQPSDKQRRPCCLLRRMFECAKMFG